MIINSGFYFCYSSLPQKCARIAILYFFHEELSIIAACITGYYLKIVIF